MDEQILFVKALMMNRGSIWPRLEWSVGGFNSIRFPSYLQSHMPLKILLQHKATFAVNFIKVRWIHHGNGATGDMHSGRTAPGYRAKRKYYL